MLTLTMIECDGACRFHRVRGGCIAETKRLKMVARTGKPLGYTWPLWCEPRQPQKVPMGPVARAWVTDALTPAWKRPRFRKAVLHACV